MDWSALMMSAQTREAYNFFEIMEEAEVAARAFLEKGISVTMN